MKYDDVVIGGGVSGLTTAVLLAQNGRRVCVLEQAAQIAPTIRGFVRKGTYFDTGFHYGTMLGEGEPFRRLCERLGIMSDIDVRPYACTADSLYVTEEGFTFDFESGLDKFIGRLIGLFADERPAIVRFGDRVRDFLTRLNDSFFATVMNPAAIFQNGSEPFSKYLDSNFSSPRLKTILSSHAVLYGSVPQETSVDYHTMVCGAYYDRSWQIVGGGRAIVDGFARKLRECGVAVHTGCHVARIRTDEGKAVEAVVLENGETIFCENCIFTGHPRNLVSMLPAGSLRPVYQSRLESLEDTVSAIVVYCRSGKAGREGALNNTILLHRQFPDLFCYDAAFANRPMYISRSIGENRSDGLSIICPCLYGEVERWKDSVVGERPAAYYQWKREAAEAVVEGARKYCDGRLGDVEIVDVATPLTFRDFMGAPQGCLYGPKHRVEDMPFMPGTRVKGLYLSGQTIITAGVMGVMVAGFVTAASITKEVYE